MRSLRASILHISDLHFGSSFDSQLAAQVRARAKDIAPTYLVVSGDLVDHPFPWKLGQAKRYLVQLANDCGLDSDHVLVVPGNHDYKFFGNFGVRRLSRIPFHIYFRQDAESFWERIRLGLNWLLNALWPWGRKLREALAWREAGNDGFALVGFDSNPLFEAFAAGKVSEDQIASFTTEMGNSDRSLKWRGRLRVAVVHHHPVPIPFASTGMTARIADSLMIFYNAGTFLRQVALGGIDLILHGHKHYSGFVRVSFDEGPGRRQEIGVLAAGSATRSDPDDPGGNQFNVVKLYDDETVDIERWYHAPGVDKAKYSQTVCLYDIDGVRGRRTRRALEERGFGIKKIVKRVQVTPDGYSQVEETWRGCYVTRAGGIDKLPLKLSTERPRYLRALKLCETEAQRFYSLSPVSTPRDIDTYIDLGTTREPGGGEFEAAFSYRLMNGHAINASEFGLKSAANEEAWEYASVECTGAVESLCLEVRFPKGQSADLRGSGAEARYQSNSTEVADTSTDKQHERETRRVEGLLVHEDHVLRLEVVAPIPGFVYRIRWTYEDGQDEPVARGVEAATELTCKRLIAEKSARSAITPFLDDTLAAVESRFPGADPHEVLVLTLAVAHPEEHTLQFVAATGAEPHGLYSVKLHPGEGCAGFSFEKRRVLFYDGGRDSLGYYLRPEELDGESGLMAQTVLVTAPCYYQGMPFGVVSVGSTSICSRLLKIFDMSEADKRKEAEFFNSVARMLGELVVDSVLQGQGD